MPVQLQTQPSNSFQQMLKQATLSKLPYITPIPMPRENYNRRSEPDRFDEMALRADFVNSNPDLETVRRRAVLREHLDYHCLPRDQNFIVLTTFGPTEGFDVEAPQVGFQTWGVFGSEDEAILHVQFVRKTNPHAVFLPVHIVQLGKRIDLPPPNDGSTVNHQLNKEYSRFMERHLNKSVVDAEEVHNRKESTVAMTKDRNETVQKFNDIHKTLDDIARHRDKLGNDDGTEAEEEHQQELERILSKLDTYKNGRESNLKTITPGNRPFEECINDLKSIPPQLLDAYIKCYEASSTTLPSHLKVEYRTHVREDGEICIVRVILGPKSKKVEQQQ